MISEIRWMRPARSWWYDRTRSTLINISVNYTNMAMPKLEKQTLRFVLLAWSVVGIVGTTFIWSVTTIKYHICRYLGHVLYYPFSVNYYIWCKFVNFEINGSWVWYNREKMQLEIEFDFFFANSSLEFCCV